MGSKMLISPENGKGKQHPKQILPNNQWDVEKGSLKKHTGTKWSTWIVDFTVTHRPCASWHGPSCKTSSHRSRRRTSSRRSHGRSCCARATTTASWRLCHRSHTWRNTRASGEWLLEFTWGWDIKEIVIWNSLYKYNPGVCVFIQTLEHAL